MIAWGIKNLFPGYFSLVMATGIVTIAADLLKDESIAGLLFKINQAAYVVLCALTFVRCIAYPSRLVADFMNPEVAPGFLTVVAGTCILGSEFVLFSKNYDIGLILWLAGFLLWIMLTYALFIALVVSRPATSPAAINGSWLLAVVATQALSVLGTLLASPLADHWNALVLSALSLYLLGCILYVSIILLVAYRLIFLPLDAQDFLPSYWINMGAAAITTLAGATLILHASLSPWLQAMSPFLKGFTLLFWAFGTWWIPCIIILGAWRYFYKGFPICYDAGYWSMVFPLSMYSTCTDQMAKALDIPILHSIPLFFFSASLSAWIVVFAGFIHELYCAIFGRRIC